MPGKTTSNMDGSTGNEDIMVFAPIAEAVAALLKPHAEVVIHDLRTQTIGYIANNLSRREVGGSSLAELKDIGSLGADVIGPYRKTNFDGRQLKSITAVLRNKVGEPFGLLCINFDIAPIEAARDALNLLAAFQGAGAQPSALFRADWQETVNAAIADFLGERGWRPPHSRRRTTPPSSRCWNRRAISPSAIWSLISPDCSAFRGQPSTSICARLGRRSYRRPTPDIPCRPATTS